MMQALDGLGDHAALITICALLFGLALLALCLVAVLNKDDFRASGQYGYFGFTIEATNKRPPKPK